MINSVKLLDTLYRIDATGSDNHFKQTGHLQKLCGSWHFSICTDYREQLNEVLSYFNLEEVDSDACLKYANQSGSLHVDSEKVEALLEKEE